jgi:hypothetical protein
MKYGVVWTSLVDINPSNAELNPICHLLTLLRAHHIFHVSGLRVKTGNPRRAILSRINSMQCEVTNAFQNVSIFCRSIREIRPVSRLLQMDVFWSTCCKWMSLVRRLFVCSLAQFVKKNAVRMKIFEFYVVVEWRVMSDVVTWSTSCLVSQTCCICWRCAPESETSRLRA